MRKGVAILSFLLLLPLATAQVSVNPSSLTINTNPNTNFRKYFQISSNFNDTLTVYISKQGIVYNWCTVEPNIIILQPNHTETFYCQFIIPQVSGTFQGYLIIDAVDTRNNVVVDGLEIPITINVQTTQPNASVGEVEEMFDFLTTSYGVSIQKGHKFVKSFYLRNDMDVRVEVKDFDFVGSGCIMTPEGGKPVRIDAWELSYLEPNEETTIDVTIDGNLPTGTYKCTLEVYGLTSDKRRVVADLLFTINVIEEPSPMPTIKFYCTEEAFEGDKVEVVLENIDSTMRIYHSIPFKGNVERSANKWRFYGSPGKGTYNVTVLISKAGNFLEKHCVIKVKEKPKPKIIKIDYTITGGKLKIIAKDQFTGEVLNADIRVDGNPYTGPIEVTPGETYLITATYPDYQSASVTVNVPLKKMKVEVTPESPIEGDLILIKCTSGGEEVPCKITVDGKEYKEPVKLAPGTHTIRATLEKYEPVEYILTVSEKPGLKVTQLPIVGALTSYWWVLIIIIGAMVVLKKFKFKAEKIPEPKYYPKAKGPLEKLETKGKYEEEGE